MAKWTALMMALSSCLSKLGMVDDQCYSPDVGLLDFLRPETPAKPVVVQETSEMRAASVAISLRSVCEEPVRTWQTSIGSWDIKKT